MQCVCLEQCPFFNDRMKNMPTTASVLKQRLCMSGWQACARHMVFEVLGREAVPSDLYPDEVDRARAILAAAN